MLYKFDSQTNLHKFCDQLVRHYWRHFVSKQTCSWPLGRDGGQEVSMLAFNFDDPSLNPAEAYGFSVIMCLKRTKKSPGLVLFHQQPLNKFSAKHFYSFGRKPWSSGYGRRIFAPKVLSSNPSTIYWMDIFSYLIDVKIVMCI